MKGDCIPDPAPEGKYQGNYFKAGPTPGRAEWYGEVEPTPNTITVEKDPTGRVAHTHGSKLDAGKPPVFQGALNYFGKAIRAIATVSLYGATKYVWRGWEGVPDGVNRYANALGRHLTDTATVPEADKDLIKYLEEAFPGVPITPEIVHASQAAWNACASLELRLRNATVTVIASSK